MLERLLELLLHAKSGVFAGVLVLGTTGALVTATVATAGNVTTITLTQASASPSANNNVELRSPTTSPTRSPKPTPTEEPSSSPSNTTAATTTSATTCTPDQNASAAVKTVNSAFSMFHTDLMHLRTDNNKGDAGKSVVEKADKVLKQIRQDAVKLIHASASCKTDTDDENDEDQTEEDTDEKDATHNDADHEDENDAEDESDDDKAATSSTSTVATTTTTTATGDAKTIADNAVAAMKLVFDTAKAELAKLPTSATTPKPARSPEHSDKKSDHKGKSGSGDHQGHDD